MSKPTVHITDGGHQAAGMRGKGKKSCVPRAIAIALDLDYRETHDALEAAQQEWATTGRTSKAKRRAAGKTIAQVGVHKPVYTAFLAERGWHHVSLMSVGQKRDRNPRFSDLPTTGTVIANVSKHLCAVVEGVIHDTHDPTRGGTRTVYGYFTKRSDMSNHTRGPWVTQGEVAAAREWLATDHRTGTRAKQAIEGMMYTAGRDPASQLIERADYLARVTLRLESGYNSEPTDLPEIHAVIAKAEEV